MSNNNGSGQTVPGVATAGTAGDLWQVATDTFGLVDSQIAATSISNMSGTPTKTCDTGGAGSGATCTFETGYADGGGVVSVSTGTGTGANAGIVTINFSVTYPFTPICWYFPANAAANNATAAPLITFASVTPSQFIITSGATALTASGGPFFLGYGCKKPGS
jgi:hypothetical protein